MRPAIQLLLPAIALTCAAISPALAQSSEQRLWRLAAGMSSGRGYELLSAAYEPGTDLYAAVDFVTRTTRSMRSIGYFLGFARYSYDDGAFWTTVRNSTGGAGAPIIEGAGASLATLGAVGKFGPVYGRLRPYGSLSVGLFRNSRGDLTVPGLTPSDPSKLKLGSKSGIQTGIGIGADVMGRRLGFTVDAGYQINWTSSHLDRRYQICDGSACDPAAGSSHTLYARLGVALVRGRF